MLPLKIVRAPRTALNSPPLTTKVSEQGKETAYLAWQGRVKPQLAKLDHNGLRNVLFDAEKQLPLVPEKEFLDAWLEASKPLMPRLPVSIWELTEKLGAQPTKEFVRLLGLAARDRQLKNQSIVLDTLVHVMLRWRGTPEAMEPYLAAVGEAVVTGIRVQGTGRLYTGVAEKFHEAGYVPSREFLQEWITNARRLLPKLVGAKAVWRLMDTAALVPTDDPTLALPLIEEWVQQKPRMDGVSDAMLISALLHFADFGLKPPSDWIDEVSAELLRRLGKSDDRTACCMLKAMSTLVTPERDQETATSFAYTWARVSAARVKKWPGHALVESLAAAVRLRMHPDEIGEHWFATWLLAAHRRLGRDANSKEDIEQDLLARCRSAARDLFVPWRWEGADVPFVVKSVHLLRQLRDVHALNLKDDHVIRLWLAEAKHVGGFRHHQVERAAQYLRDLGAEEAAQGWELFNAKCLNEPFRTWCR